MYLPIPHTTIFNIFSKKNLSTKWKLHVLGSNKPFAQYKRKYTETSDDGEKKLLLCRSCSDYWLQRQTPNLINASIFQINIYNFLLLCNLDPCCCVILICVMKARFFFQSPCSGSWPSTVAIELSDSLMPPRSGKQSAFFPAKSSDEQMPIKSQEKEQQIFCCLNNINTSYSAY